MEAGPSAEISKAVIEIFTHLFLQNPALLWLSSSDDKVVARDDKLAASIGLRIAADRNLPDIILVDLGPEHPGDCFYRSSGNGWPVTARRQRPSMI